MPSIFSMIVMASIELLKRFYPFVALVIGLLITGLIMWVAGCVQTGLYGTLCKDTGLGVPVPWPMTLSHLVR
jgi:hypothetical protein